jgi:transcriptional regulator GlxA family with amidase domain
VSNNRESAAADTAAGPRTVEFLVFPDFQVLDLTGPLEVFSQAERRRPGSYTLRTVALDPGPVTSSSGLPVLAAPPASADVDTVIVVGGRSARIVERDPRHLAWIAAAARRSRRIASVCTGAFPLAAAGILDGRRATTHWQSCAALAAAYPAVTVDPDPIFVRDGDVWTSAGVTAGIDLALALLEADHDAALARAVARQLVVFVQRPGGQTQFSAQLTAQRPQREPLRAVQSYIAQHPEADLSVPTLAARAGMSERHFARVFRAETGSSPAAHVEAIRVETARRLLESTTDGLDRIARAAGFGTPATMHRAFRRTVRITPGEYRDRFRSA